MVATLHLSKRRAKWQQRVEKTPHRQHQHAPRQLASVRRYCADRWQVFGLAGAALGAFLLTVASRLIQSQCLRGRLSFLLTAAGQPWIFTRFPFHSTIVETNRNTQYTVVIHTESTTNCSVFVM